MQEQNQPRKFLQLSPEGTFFGYPACCDDEFNRVRILMMDRGLRRHLEPRKLNGSGFVPCTKCNAEKTEEQLVIEINMRRMYDRPFPTDHGKDPEFHAKFDACDSSGALQLRMIENQISIKATYDEKLECLQAMVAAFEQHKVENPELANDARMLKYEAILEQAKQKLPPRPQS